MGWVGPCIIIGRFGNKYALSHYRGNWFEVDRDDMMSTAKISDVLGGGWVLRLHLPNSKCPLQYLVGPHTLVLLSEMWNSVSEMPINYMG